MKRFTIAFCMLSVFAATAPAFADCAGHASTTPTSTTASSTTGQKGG